MRDIEVQIGFFQRKDAEFRTEEIHDRDRAVELSGVSGEAVHALVLVGVNDDGQGFRVQKRPVGNHDRFFRLSFGNVEY